MILSNNFTLLLVTLSYLLIYANAQFRIVKGQSSSITDSPFIVSVHYKNKYDCVGSLVSMELVVTAARCLYKRETKSITVIAGVTDLRLAGECRIARRRYVPKDYNDETKNMDIGVIKVSEPFPPGPTIDSIKLCSTVFKPGTKMQISGWGVTSSMADDPENILRTAFVPVVARPICAGRYGTIRKSVICAGLAGSGTCVGDSGAPGVVKGQLCAVAAGGIDCGSNLYPGIYTNISNPDVLSFIKKLMKPQLDGVVATVDC